MSFISKIFRKMDIQCSVNSMTNTVCIGVKDKTLFVSELNESPLDVALIHFENKEEQKNVVDELGRRMEQDKAASLQATMNKIVSKCMSQQEELELLRERNMYLMSMMKILVEENQATQQLALTQSHIQEEEEVMWS